jgi:hypothetical protein
MIRRCNQHCGIFESEMSFCAPSRVCLNGNEWFVGPRLHPPRSAPCVDDDPLSRMRACDATRDAVNAFSATLRRRWNLSEFDGGGLRGLRRPAAQQNATEEQNKKEASSEKVLNSYRSQISPSGFSANGNVLHWLFCVDHSTSLPLSGRPRKTFGDLRAMAGRQFYLVSPEIAAAHEKRQFWLRSHYGFLPIAANGVSILISRSSTRRPLLCRMNGIVWTSSDVLWMLVCCRLSTRRGLECHGNYRKK